MDWGTDQHPFVGVSIRCLVHQCIELIFTSKVRAWTKEKFDSIWTVNAPSREMRLEKSREPD